MKDDLRRLDGSQRKAVQKNLLKLAVNPLPYTEGGYGKPLGKRSRSDLSGFLKVKMKRLGIRIVYQLVRTETEVLIVVIGMRKDDEVYELAQKRIQAHQLK